MNRELKRKIKEQLWKSAEEYTRKDRIKIKIWWYLRPILPAQKNIRDVCKEIKRATKILKKSKNGKLSRIEKCDNDLIKYVKEDLEKRREK